MKRNPELVERAKAMRNAGQTYVAIALELGANVTTVMCWLDPDHAETRRERKARRRSRARKPRPQPSREADKEAAARMRADGYSYDRIARVLSVSTPTVAIWLDPAAAERAREKNGVGQKIHKQLVEGQRPKQAPAQIGEAEIIDLARRGYGKQAIAAVLRCPYRLVEKVLS